MRAGRSSGAGRPALCRSARDAGSIAAHSLFHAANRAPRARTSSARWRTASLAFNSSSASSTCASSLATEIRTVSSGAAACSVETTGAGVILSTGSIGWAAAVAIGGSIAGPAGCAVGGPPPMARPMTSSSRWAASKAAGAGASAWRFHAANVCSSDSHCDSMSMRSTARAAPFKLCAARKTVSTRRLLASSPGGDFSSSSSPLAIVCRCSSASTANVARSVRRKSSSAPISVRLHLVAVDQLLQPLAEIADVAGGELELLGARDVLDARLLDAFHGRRDLVHAHLLLLAGGGDLGRRLGGVDDAAGQRFDRFASRDGLPGAGFHGLGALLGGHDGGRRGFLDVAQNRSHLPGRFARLLGQTLDFLGDDAEPFAVIAGLGRLDGGVDGEQVRLRREILDRRDDLADRLALLAQLHHAG